MKSHTLRGAKTLSFFLMFFVMYIFGGVASAQESTSVKLQPTIIEESVDPGSTLTRSVRVTNLGTAPLNYTVSVQDIDTINERGQPIFSDEHVSTGFEFSSWVTFPESTVVIAGGETKSVSFTVTIPKDAAPGAHFGAIFAGIRGEKPKTSGAGVGYRVGTILSLKVSGVLVENANIREFSTTKNVYNKPSVPMLVKVENLGNTLVRPRGFVEIMDMFGRKVATVKVNDDGGAVLPKAKRDFNVTWNDDGFRIGKFNAMVSLVYGDDAKKTITSTTSFWVVPMGLVGWVVGSILFLILSVYFGVRMYIRKKMRQISGTSSSSALSRRDSGPISRGALMMIVFLAIFAIFLIALFFFLA